DGEAGTARPRFQIVCPHPRRTGGTAPGRTQLAHLRLRRTRPIRWPTRPHCGRTAERVRMRGAARGGGGERSTCVPSSRYTGIHPFGLVVGQSAPSTYRKRTRLVSRLVGLRTRGAQCP